MTIIDYHNFTLEDALAHAERLVFVVRTKRRTDDVEFITGFGVIRNELMERLKTLGLSPSLKLGNEGVIVCVIQ
jgi:hypothetical protein